MKSRTASRQIPPMELAIMNLLWDHGPSSVQEVQTRLPGNPAYTTVQTTLNTMEKKGRTKRTLRGRAFVYRAALARRLAMKTAVKDLVDRVFGGSVDSLLMNLMTSGQLDEATLDRLRKLIPSKEDEA